MIRQLILIGFGGFIGSVGRYLLSSTITKAFSNPFPFGTFTVNVLGCLVIGLIYGISERFGWLTQEWRLFLATGVCGGFTTFSAFAYEGFKLIETSQYLTFVGYVILSVVICLLAVFLGVSLSRL